MKGANKTDDHDGSKLLQTQIKAYILYLFIAIYSPFARHRASKDSYQIKQESRIMCTHVYDRYAHPKPILTFTI
jgi:hypothetical protein